MGSDRAVALRAEILDLVRRYHAEAFPAREFVPGTVPLPCAGRVFDEEDLASLVDASLDFWLTTGRFAEQFERDFARRCGVRHALLVNSGSSANLVALSALTSPSLGPDRLRARRRGHHRRRRLPDDGQPDHSEQPGAGLRRRPRPHLQHRRDAARGGPFGPDPRDHGGPHARQSVRPRGRDRIRPQARPLADRGLLRRRRGDLSRAGRSAPSATWRPSASTRPTTSRWAREARC